MADSGTIRYGEGHTKQEKAAKAAADKQEAVSGLQQNVSTWQDILSQLPSISNDAYNDYVGLADEISQKSYYNDPGTFDYDKEISDFLNPNTTTLTQEAGNAVKRANPLRSGYGLDVDAATAMSDKYDALFNEAKNEWTSDRDYEHTLWEDENKRQQTLLDAEKAQDTLQMNVAKQLADWENERNQQYMSTMAEAQKAMADSLAQNGLTWADLGGNPFTLQTANMENISTNANLPASTSKSQLLGV